MYTISTPKLNMKMKKTLINKGKIELGYIRYTTFSYKVLL